ncbi:spore coat U domain-containing protein [Rhodanobacter soli]|uniref:spore coat U domain-containing protein n=1 Tax=Rhodanobacter soli TaxID=590609 RepID=UPI0031D638A7
MKRSISVSAERPHCWEAIRRGYGHGGQRDKSGAQILMRRLSSFIAFTLALMPALAIANEATGTLRISLTVVTSCSVRTQPLTFATHTAGGSTTGTATPGAIDVSCTRGIPVAVYLDGDRTLAGPAGARVAYTVQANGQAWPAGASIAVLGQGAQPIRLRLSGNVPAGQNVMPGDYADAAVVRVVY